MKKGLVGMVILGAFVFLLVVGIGAGVYFYNYHVFKEVRICMTNELGTQMPCTIRQDCVDFMITQGVDFSALDDAPEFIKIKAGDIMQRSIRCEETCFVRGIRGIDFATGELEMLDSCNAREDEIVIEIRGKEGIEIWEWMRAQSE